MQAPPCHSRLARAVALVAALFGLMTIVSGTRVLMGADPGYVVFAPLLYFNTVMGVVYMVVAWMAWQGHRAARIGAGVVAGLNVLALTVIAFLASSGAAIAQTSLAAMAFRVIVWLVLFALLVKAFGRRAPAA